MNHWNGRTLAAALLSALSLGLGLTPAALSAAAKRDAGWSGRTYDLRNTLPASQSLASDPAREAAIARLKASLPDLYVSRDERSGATRSLQNLSGYLTGTRAGGDAEALAASFVRSELALLGLTEDDFADYEVTNLVPSEATGLTHVYLRQRYEGLPVFNGQLQVNLKGDGRVLSVHNQFLPNLAAAVNTTEPVIAATAAVGSVAALLGDRAAGMIDHAAQARLMILPVRAGEARLVWNFQVETADHESWYDANVDAVDGRVWTLFDWIDSETESGPAYRVYQMPNESPNHAVPLPPADGRALLFDPADLALASPFGWHDTNGVAGAEFTTTQGNNVHAYTDTNADDVPDAGSSPDGTVALQFDFPLDLTMAPSTYRPATVTNLFYWNNIQHDVLVHYGFNEVAGNFQEMNYSATGLGSDYVQAEAQDGSGLDNANFGTPVDGQNPRMQMYLWDLTAPFRDGDLDSGIILHEYGHGVSNRLTGGPANVDCLDNTEQMGEGWSDWMSVVFTAKAADTATTNRGVGTYALGQPVNGVGIRPAPYNTDLGTNNYDYGDLPSMAVPHGVGFIWNTMLWEMYWELVTEHGFNPDLYAAWSTGGNNLAMQLVIDGMKLQPCSPGFVDGRNAILAADLALTGGDNACLIWEAFAKRGLGASAAQGSSGSSSDGTAAFDIPTSCSFGDVGADKRVCNTETEVQQSILVGPAYTLPPVDMDATGVPAGSTVGWSEDPVSGPLPESTMLTISGLLGATPGVYPIQVSGTDSNAVPINHLDSFDLTIDGAPAAATTLVAPADGATGVSTAALLSWTAVAGVTAYDVEVDNDPAFLTPEYSATVAGTSTSASGLLADTLYHWRVKSLNGCGGVFTASRSFTTALEYCQPADLPIPDAGVAVSNNIVIPPGGAAITDLDVSLVANHTWVGDLTFTLSNGVTTVAFFDRPGRTTSGFGCSGDNVDVVANDEGPDGNIESQCSNAPAIFGNRVGGDPANSALLAAFDGASISGTWTLSAQDFAGADVGTLLEWCIYPAIDTMPFLDGFESSNTSKWSSTADGFPAVQ